MTSPFQGDAAVLASTGFALVTLPQPMAEVVAATFAAALAFFRSPPEAKASSVLAEECGYRPFGVEYSRSADHPDMVESFSATARVRPSPADLTVSTAWALYQQMARTFDALESVAETLNIELARHVGRASAAERLRGGIRRWSRLQVNYSKPSSITGALINELHEDGNLLTLGCATAGGLEVQPNENDLVPVWADGAQVIAMPGEVMWLLTGGRIKPLHHQVRASASSEERLSLLFFADLDPRLCEPWLPGPNNRDIDIGERVRRNVGRFGLSGFSED